MHIYSDNYIIIDIKLKHINILIEFASLLLKFVLKLVLITDKYITYID